MKYLLLFIFPVWSAAYAQNVTFKEIKLKPNPAFYNVTVTTIVYPLVVTGNKLVDKLINNKIKEEMLDPDEDNISARKALANHINEGLINLSYEVTFKKRGLLSMKIDAEGCGAHCSSWATYFTFDLKTGQPVTISDLVFENKVDSFQKVVFTDKLKALTEYKREAINYLAENKIDSASYNWALEQVDNCMKTVVIESFSLSDQGIEIIDPCEFPHAIRSQEPIYQLLYSYNFMHSFLKPKFKPLLAQ